MSLSTRHASALKALLTGCALFLATSLALADPPARVARVGVVDGPVSFSPAGEDDWLELRLNRPLGTGDRLWTDTRARTELQIGGAMLHLDERTTLTLLDFDDRVGQFELTQGTVVVSVRRLDRNQRIEIGTPNLALVIRRPGHYRISVDPRDDMTEVLVREGQAQIHGRRGSYAVDAEAAFRFYGPDLDDYEVVAMPRTDGLDRWARERDRQLDRSTAARYVSRDVIGAHDLDEYGEWRVSPEYGNVWIPTRVRPGWAPYRDGHWAWIDPWGWTWIDDAPWGFAVSHYGRWAPIGGTWAWIPGPVRARAVYAPALVAFIGGSNYQVIVGTASVRAVGWFPLGPRDVYRPAYPVSEDYFTNVNVTNTVINTTNITNIYRSRGAGDVRYGNQTVPGAVVMVPTQAFVRSQPVAQSALQLPREAGFAAPAAFMAPLAPVQASVRGASGQGAQPPQQAIGRGVVATTKPPPPPVSFSIKEPLLADNPGKPVDPTVLQRARPALAKPPGPEVRVLRPDNVAVPPASRQAPTLQRMPADQPRADAPAAAAPAAELPKLDPRSRTDKLGRRHLEDPDSSGATQGP